MASRYSLSNIESVKGKKIFFDANVLIYLYGYGTPTYANWESQYATLYASLNRQSNEFVVDYIVLSEFINRAIKIEYANYLEVNGLTKKDLNYKEYRNSVDGKEALADIYLSVKDEILNEFEVVEKSYSKDDLTLMCSVDNLDFSDKAIEMICHENNFVLLTNDTDFQDSGIDILSCHNRLR
jgi:predicted nucleic acid-binding protein